MTAIETAAALRRVADAVQQAGSPSLAKFPTAMLQGEAAVGAAGYLCYLRDLITASPIQFWSQVELLVLLETMSRDREVFPLGIGVVMWDMEEQS